MPILFFDTETTGKIEFQAPYFATCQPNLVQLGALLTDDEGNDLVSLTHIIKPQGWVIPQDVIEIHGITNEIANEKGLPLAVVISAFQAMVEKATLFVSHNYAFDHKVIRTAYSRNRQWSKFEPSNAFCTMQKSRRHCKLPKTKCPTLTETYKHFFNEDLQNAHDALVDVQACKRVYFALMALENKTPEIPN